MASLAWILRSGLGFLDLASGEVWHVGFFFKNVPPKKALKEWNSHHFGNVFVNVW